MPAFAVPPRRPALPHPPIAAPHIIPSTGALGTDDLIAVAKLEAHASSDQFSDDPTLAFVGRDFTTMIPAKETVSNYDKDTHTLTVATPTYSDTIDLSRIVTTGEYSGQNSYGARAVITKVRGNVYGLWLPGQSYNRKPITYSASLDGVAARALSGALRLRVTGKIIKADGVYAEKNSAIYKKDDLADATISDPYDTWVKGYFVAVQFTKAEWIDSRSGAVISSVDLPAN